MSILSRPILESSIVRSCRTIAKVRGARMLKLEQLKGWTDYIILYKGKVVFTEFKRPLLGVLSPSQKRVRHMLISSGFTYALIDSKQDFVDLLNELDS